MTYLYVFVGHFATVPPNARPDGSHMYGILIVGNRQPPNYKENVQKFMADIERDANQCGINIRCGGPPMTCSDNSQDIDDKLRKMQQGGARIVIVMLIIDAYGDVKLAADRLGLITQCLKWKNIERPPRGYHANIMLKINTKMGGTNHTLASRMPKGVPFNGEVFQDPPASLSWLFDKPCMLIGVDVSHPEPGSNRESMAVVVGSMNGRASQYVALVSIQPARVEMVSALEDNVKKLFETFKARNGGKMPAHVIVFRDGVSDGQMDRVLDIELPAFQGAVALMGYQSSDVKISIVVCQKGHHTRFPSFYLLLFFLIYVLD